VAVTENGTRTDFVLDIASSPESVLQEETDEETTTYAHGLGLVSRETATGITYLLTDALGSTRLETDESGNVTMTRDYDAFGKQLGSHDLSGNRFRYSGQYADVAGLTCLRARDYELETGTFLSVDPLPSSGSPYAYCGGNPMTGVDPTGETRWDQFQKGVRQPVRGCSQRRDLRGLRHRSDV